MELLHVLLSLLPAESQCFLHKSGGSGGRSTDTVTSLFILMLEFQFRGNLFTSFINTRTKRRLGFIEKGRKLGKRARRKGRKKCTS